MGKRHSARALALQTLYEWDFHGGKVNVEDVLLRNRDEFFSGLKDIDFAESLVKGVIKHKEKIDEIIVKTSPQWPLEQMGILDRNILRLGIFELIFGDKKAVPPKVAINEAIELAKEFVGEVSGKFVNGILGTVFKLMEEIEKKNENS